MTMEVTLPTGVTRCLRLITARGNPGTAQRCAWQCCMCSRVPSMWDAGAGQELREQAVRLASHHVDAQLCSDQVVQREAKKDLPMPL